MTLTQNRINDLFAQKNERLLNVYFTAGYPQLADTRTVLQGLQQAWHNASSHALNSERARLTSGRG